MGWCQREGTHVKGLNGAVIVTWEVFRGLGSVLSKQGLLLRVNDEDMQRIWSE